MTQLVKDSLPDLLTVVERVVEVVVPATSYQVEIAGGTTEQIQEQKAAIKPKSPSSSFGTSGGSGSGNAYSYNAYSYDGVVWVKNEYNRPISPVGWTVL